VLYIKREKNAEIITDKLAREYHSSSSFHPQEIELETHSFTPRFDQDPYSSSLEVALSCINK
jgi:hypothetical protein